MKNLKKILAVMTSVAAICTSMTAFAAEATTSFTPNGVADVFTFTYDNTTGTISNLTLGDAVQAGDVTILVTNPDVARQNVGENDILYIDQSTKADGFNASMGLRNVITFTEAEITGKTEPITKTVPVYVGYTSATGFTIADGSITAVYTPASGETTVKLTFGDIDCDGEAGLSDAGVIINKLAGGTATFEKNGKSYTIGQEFSIE